MFSKLLIQAVGIFLLPSASAQCLSPLVSPAQFAPSYDYVIVGGGTAGLTVAARLSEDPRVTVGVLEAGLLRIPDINVSAPFFDSRIVGNPVYDWMFATVPQDSAAGRSIPAPRGKLMGGSSAINGMAWTRASKEDYAAWDTLNDHQGGWTWDTLLPYFKKIETRQSGIGLPGVENLPIDDGLAGPIKSSLNVNYSDIVPKFVSSMNALNIRTNTNPMGGNTTGLYNTLVAVDRSNGSRTDSAVGYYCPNAARPNLHVLTGALATKLLFAPKHGNENLTATGVAFTSGGKDFSVTASKEVVVSAGVIKTPQLLELSGIGNATLLKSLGINSLLDLPGVGENFQEHPYVTSSFQLEDGFHTFDAMENATFAAEQLTLYEATGGGLLAGTDTIITFLPQQDFLNASTVASLRAIFDRSVAQLDSTPLAKAQYAIHRQWLAEGNVPEIEIIQLSRGVPTLVPLVMGKNYLSSFSGLMHAVSRGSVHINSTNPEDHPVIIGNYLSNDYDIQVLIELARFNRKIAATPPLSSAIAFQAGPSPNTTSDADLAAYIRETFTVGSHIIGTAAMASQANGGVLTPQLVVYGTNNLRVVDISVFPMQLASHLQVTVYAVAERASDFIKAANKD